MNRFVSHTLFKKSNMLSYKFLFIFKDNKLTKRSGEKFYFRFSIKKKQSKNNYFCLQLSKQSKKYIISILFLYTQQFGRENSIKYFILILISRF